MIAHQLASKRIVYVLLSIHNINLGLLNIFYTHKCMKEKMLSSLLISYIVADTQNSFSIIIIIVSFNLTFTYIFFSQLTKFAQLLQLIDKVYSIFYQFAKICDQFTMDRQLPYFYQPINKVYNFCCELSSVYINFFCG